jgi:hypothetical protein
MNARTRGSLGEAALADVLRASGVDISPEDVAPVARSLARIEQAATLLPAPTFDDTTERFYRLLESDGYRLLEDDGEGAKA